MPAKSVKQQRLMGAAEGGASFPLAEKIRETMKPADLKDFASTPHAGLPMKVKAPKAPKAARSTDSLHSGFRMRDGAGSHPGLSHKLPATIDSLHPKMGYK